MCRKPQAAVKYNLLGQLIGLSQEETLCEALVEASNEYGAMRVIDTIFGESSIITSPSLLLEEPNAQGATIEEHERIART